MGGNEGGTQIVIFEEAPVLDAVKTRERGRPIYKPVVRVRIKGPHSRDEFVTKATDEHRERYPKQWERFARVYEKKDWSGTLLAECPAFTRTEVAELNGIKIFTIEQIITPPPGTARTYGPGWKKIQQKAEIYLDKADAESVLHENRELRSRVEQMTKENARIMKELAGAHSELRKIDAKGKAA